MEREGTKIGTGSAYRFGGVDGLYERRQFSSCKKWRWDNFSEDKIWSRET